MDLFRFTFIGLIFFGFGISSETWGQESPYVERCRSQLALAPPKSQTQLLAKFKLIDALLTHDLALALQNAHEAEGMASDLGLPDSIKLSRYYSGEIDALSSHESRKARSNADRDLMELSASAPGELSLLYGLARLQFEVINDNFSADYQSLIEYCDRASSQAQDTDLIVRQKAWDLWVRNFQLSEPTESQSMTEKIDDLDSLIAKSGSTEALIVLHLVRGKIAFQADDSAGRHDHLEFAIEQAKATGHQFFLYQAAHQISIDFHRAKNWDACLDATKECLLPAKALGAQICVFNTYRRLAGIEKKLKNDVGAERYTQLAIQSPAVEQLSLPQRSSFFSSAVSLFRNIGHREVAKRFVGELISPRNVMLIRSETAARRQQSRQLNLAYRQVEEKSQTVDKLNSQSNLLEEKAIQLAGEKADLHQQGIASEKKAHATIGFWKTYAVTMTLIVLLLSLLVLSWLRLRFQRIKLTQVSDERDSVKQQVRATQYQCDDLARRLNRLQRMESLGLMAGSIAHDFNNILVGVLGNAEVIQLNGNLDDHEFVKQRIHNIITSAEKAASLSRQMLAYAGKQYIEKRAVDLNELIRQYESVLNSSCRQNQQLILNLHSEQVLAKVDTTQIEQVILNLVTNSVTAIDENGTIEIRTGYETITDVEQDASLFGNRTLGGEFCFIEVKDNGQGISKEDHDRIFEPFYTKSEVGRGLGLSVVYGAVRGHDGLIRSQSNLKQGTLFRILFPVATEKSPVSLVPAPHAKFEKRPIRDTQRSILVIDDEESVLDLCSQLIHMDGYNVITSMGGKQGLEKAEEYCGELACILIDVVMPEMGANEVLKALEERNNNIPIILMSGFSQTKLEFFLERPNVVTIIQKPFPAIELQKAIELASRFSEAIPTAASSSFNAPSSVERRPR